MFIVAMVNNTCAILLLYLVKILALVHTERIHARETEAGGLTFEVGNKMFPTFDALITK